MPRVLIVTYHFPPEGGSGTLRALRFARYLPLYGWQPLVVCAQPLPHAGLDESLQRAVPPDLEVYRVPTFEPGRFEDHWGRPGHKLLRHLFRLFDFLLVPDDHAAWSRPARRQALRLMPFDALITSGPPFSSHLVGLSPRLDMPWIADFRDDWTGFNEAFGVRKRFPRRQAAMERAVLDKATVVLTVNEPLRNALAARAPGTRVKVIKNGYDPADFEGPPPPLPATFTLTHAGSLYQQRSPAPLLQALRRCAADLRGSLVAQFLGRIERPAQDLLSAADLSGVVQLKGVVSHTDSIAAMRASHALLLIIDQVSVANQVFTGKVFEYLAARRPILCLGPPQSPLADLLRAAWGGHRVVAPDDLAGIEAALRDMVRLPTLEPVPLATVVASHSADNLSEQLARLLDDVCSQNLL